MRNLVVAMLIACLALCTACSSNDNGQGGGALPEWVEIDAGSMTVRIRTNHYAMEILGPEGQVLLATVVEAVKSATDGVNLSPMPFLPHAFQVDDFGGKWYYAREVLDVAVVDGDTQVTVLAVDTGTGQEEATLTLLFQVHGDDHLAFTASAYGPEGIRYHTGAYRLDADERFFGLGLQYDAIDSRGKLRTMFLGLGIDGTDQIQNHAPMPFYISSRGYGLFVEEKGKGYFDMGRADTCAYGYKYRALDLTTHIFWGPDPLDVIDAYTELTGRPPMNPDYMFGHLHWRNKNQDESEVYADADALRAHGIPTSSIMVDAPWSRAYSTFEFAECPSGCMFSDAQAMIDYVHDRGYAFYLWTADFTNETSPIEAPGMVEDNARMFRIAKENGYLIPIFGAVYQYPWWHGNGAMVNFLNPDAYQWFQDLARNVVEMGVQGFKMDGGEFVGADTLGLYPLEVFDLGGFGNPNTAHHYYRWAYHRLFKELADEYNGDLGIATVRTAAWGEQAQINYFWPGDMKANWGFELGLPADIAGGLTLGTAGFPYYGSNNGGFSDYQGDEDPLLMARWTAYSAFRPIFESPKNGTQEIWEAGYPPQTEEIYRKYAVIHTRLFPYMKAYALEAAQTGHPIMRMLPLHYLDDRATYDRDFDYMLGDWLLVAPVYLEGEYTRDVYLPAGRWIDYWGNEVIEGPVLIIRDAPEDSIPVFAHAGAVIPMLDASVETLWPTDDPDVVDHTDVADLLWVDVYPYGSTSFTMADGTAFALNQGRSGFTLEVSGAPISRTYSLRAVPAAYGGSAPTVVSGPTGILAEQGSYSAWDASASGWFFDAGTGNLWIRDTCLEGTFDIN